MINESMNMNYIIIYDVDCILCVLKYKTIQCIHAETSAHLYDVAFAGSARIKDSRQVFVT